VLIAGDFRRVSAELYDPSTGTFTATGDMSEPGADTATLLPNGTVLITHSDLVGCRADHAELYNPRSGTFTRTGDMTASHTGPTATFLTTGKVLLAGGDLCDGDGPTASAELYDLATGTFAPTSNLTTGREQHTATLLPDGTVLMTGGHNGLPVPGGGFDNIASAELYNPVTGAFSATGSMATGRDVHNATLLKNGQVLITGGNEF